ncbi:HEAT repeat domain-containing protein [Paraclostridium bifermentans]|uniref:HEAT repeat domain-containing protein n=1 Tax=Paraclostridium bifermentans TaxID=1490 RepID=UPI00359C3D26
MQNIANIYIILSFFMYIISCSIIFMIVKDMIKSRTNKKLEKIRPSFEKDILKQLEYIKDNKEISKIDIEYIREKLEKTVYIKVFNDTLKTFNKNHSNQKYTTLYMKNFEDIVIMYVRKYKRKDNILKTYMSTLLGEYRLSSYEISEFLLNCIDTKSIYLKVAALEAISKIGNIKTFEMAIESISKDDKYINNKIFTDIINQFGGNKFLLDKFLIDNLRDFGENTQKVVIEHFKNNKTEFVKDELLKYLNENINKEASISIIKYFSKIKYEKAKKKIIEFLNSKDWEYRAVCSTALGNYNCNESKMELLNSISDTNWYVRYNSAKSILSFEDCDLIEAVLAKDDRYSKDILFYAMFKNDKISYEDYLEKSGKIEVAY